MADRYRSLFVIGRGGMGSVEVAIESAGARRLVALKRMLPEATRSPHAFDMFLREARLATLLSHPNVVGALAFGEDDGGDLYLAMEYVEGEPLSALLCAARRKGGKLSPELVAHILAELCEGLHAAHELCTPNFTPLNVVHRDVSPHNMMVAYDGHVKLLDFGVAKMDLLEAGMGRTKTGEVKGKTAYMSPEQAMGEEVDRRTDLYSLGAVLFECLAGRRMWEGATDLEVLRKLALEEPPSLRQAAADAPPALCELFARLVARRREDRPATAQLVADDLRRFIAGSGASLDPRTVGAEMRRLFPIEIQERQRTLSSALVDAPAGPLRRAAEERATGWSKSRMVTTFVMVASLGIVVGAALWHRSAAAGSALAAPPLHAEVRGSVIPPPAAGVQKNERAESFSGTTKAVDVVTVVAPPTAAAPAWRHASGHPTGHAMRVPPLPNAPPATRDVDETPF